MAEGLLVGIIVAAAAGWVAWSLLLPKRMRRRLKARLAGGPKAGCGDDCGCG